MWLIDPSEAVLLRKNARHMSKVKMVALTENIKNDGFLSQIPFAIRRADGKFEILSGNHSVQAAIHAGLKEIPVMFGEEKDFDKDRRIALQLSHNSLVGEDDFAILRDLYKDIESVAYKKYSGIDEEELFGIKDCQLHPISTEDFQMTTLSFVFCESEVEPTEDILRQLEDQQLSNDRTYLVIGKVDDYIKTLTKFQQKVGVKSRSVAFAMMCEICEKWINEQEQEHKQEPEQE